MQRLVLAAIAVAAVVALFSLALSILRSRTTTTNLPAPTRGNAIQKTSFALLCGLILYVAFWGAG